MSKILGVEDDRPWDGVRNVRWEGFQELKDEETPLVLNNMVFGFDETITGNGSDQLGKFQITGKFSGPSEFSFEKTYNQYVSQLAINIYLVLHR